MTSLRRLAAVLLAIAAGLALGVSAAAGPAPATGPLAGIKIAIARAEC